ncbi:MAG: hypothetical protein AAF939_17435 [Planctomycetota bacterium]
MKRMPFYRLFLLAVLLCHAWSLPSECQEIESLEWKLGYHGFNQICSGVGLEHLNFAQWRSERPEDTILVVFGDFPERLGDYLNRGGAVLFASDATFSLVTEGIEFSNVNAKAKFREDQFESLQDCPIADVNSGMHPAIDGVKEVVCNRPGILKLLRRDQNISWLIEHAPLSTRFARDMEYYLAFVKTYPFKGKLLCLADQSVFTNQMILHGDNALFAQRSLQWLMSNKRTKVLVWDAAGGPVFPEDLNSLDVEIPPPTRREVINALKNLPPSKILEFGNEVAGMMEDQNLVNEFLREISSKISTKAMNRFLIFFAFACAFLFSFFVFVGQKRLVQRTISEIESEKVVKQKKGNRNQDRIERLMAADTLLDSFCLEVANRRFRNWGNFPEGLSVGNDERSQRMFKAMVEARKKFESATPKYWTAKRLAELEFEVNHWRNYFGLDSALPSYDDLDLTKANS